MNFKVFSTNIYVSYYFCALICLVLLTDRSGVALPCFIGILVHEISHLALMIYFGNRPREILVSPGGFTIVGKGAVPHKSQVTISLVGPFVNILGGLLFLLYYFVFKDVASLLWFGVWMVLGVINLFPSAFLDGGTAIYSYFCYKSSEKRAKTVLRITTFLSAVLFIIFTVYFFVNYGFNLTFLLFCIYLCMACFFKI